MSNYSAPNVCFKFSNRLRRRRNETLVAEFISTKSVHFQFYKGSYYPKKFRVYSFSY